MKLLKSFLFIFSFFFLFSCEETIKLDLEQIGTKYVIDAVLTNELKKHTVKIGQTADFYDTSKTPKVSGASVEISDNTGKIYRFVESEKGVYQSETAFAGEIGKTYTLKVQLSGQTFTATELLTPITPIDKLTWKINERQKRNPRDEGRFYDVLAYAKEPQNRTDFYYFRFFRNGKVVTNNGSFAAIGDDAYISENIEGLPFGIFYAEGDTAKLEMCSITRNMFVYFNDLNSVLNNDGGMFSPIPANPRSNISNGAIGLFRVSSVAKAEIVVGK